MPRPLPACAARCLQILHCGGCGRSIAATLAFALATLAAAAPLSATPPATASSTSPPAITTDAEDPARAMALPPALRGRLQAEVLAGADTPGRRFERLVRFIHAPEGLGMVYDAEATLSVADAYEARVGNCVTLTLLFLALAREAGIEARPQRIRRILSLRQEAQTLYLNSHVFAQARVGVREYAVDFVVEPVIARDAPESIDERTLLGHYYNNVAMAALARRDFAQAQQLMAIALSLDPGFAPHWSNLGVIHLRSGDPAAADRAYAEALSRDPDEPGALFNRIGLARRGGDRARAEALQLRLARAQARDPFHQFLRATALMDEARYPEAIAHYRRAIALLRGEPRFHAALAEAHARNGDARNAGKALDRAIALSRGAERERYRAARDALPGTGG